MKMKENHRLVGKHFVFFIVRFGIGAGLKEGVLDGLVQNFHLHKTVSCHLVLSASMLAFHSVVVPLSCYIGPCRMIVYQLQAPHC
jgi:hypothetical protein